jgi:outer membrane protein TolC
VEHGVLLPGDEAQLRAEIITREQELKQLASDIITGIEALEAILERDFSREADFQTPDRSGWEAPEHHRAGERPDLERLQMRQQLLETEKEAALSNRMPVVSVYANPFYGRPGFNIFNDDLTFNWIVGIKATWNFRSTRNAGLKAESIEIESNKINRDLQFLRNDQISSLDQLKAEIGMLEEQIEMDREVIRLRSTVTQEKKNQMEKGSATSADYIRALNAEERSNIQLEIRKIMRIKKIIQYETEWGWKWNSDS